MRAGSLEPGHGWAELGALHDALGWEGYAEVGERFGWGSAFGRGWVRDNAAGIGLGINW